MSPMPHTPRPAVRTRLVAIAFASVLFLVASAEADFVGYGDTGWVHDNKRDCCEDAGWIAQDESAAACEAAGGEARIPSGSVRAVCDWDTRGSGRDRLYRCVAKASVHCR